jgi:hypothetical protein
MLGRGKQMSIGLASINELTMTKVLIVFVVLGLGLGFGFGFVLVFASLVFASLVLNV